MATSRSLQASPVFLRPANVAVVQSNGPAVVAYQQLRSLSPWPVERRLAAFSDEARRVRMPCVRPVLQIGREGVTPRVFPIALGLVLQVEEAVPAAITRGAEQEGVLPRDVDADLADLVELVGGRAAAVHVGRDHHYRGQIGEHVRRVLGRAGEARHVRRGPRPGQRGGRGNPHVGVAVWGGERRAW
eukprot:gene9357-biopygen4641